MTDWQDSTDQLPAAPPGIDFWGIFLRRKWIIFAVGVVGLVLGYLNLLRTKPVYQSTAKVQIESKRPPIPLDAAGQNATLARYNDFVTTLEHPIVIKSPEIIALAVQRDGLNKLQSFKDSEPIGNILQNLSITPVAEGMNIYDLSVKGAHPDDVRKILESVIAAYEEHLNKTHESSDAENLQAMQETMEKLDEELQDRQAKYEEFRRSDRGGQLLWDAEGIARNLHQERQASIETERSRLMLEKNALEAKLASIEAAIAANIPAEVLFLTATSNDKLPEFMQPPSAKANDPTTILVPLLLEEEESISRYGSDHPRVKSIRRRIAFTKKYYQENFGIDLDSKQVASDDAAEVPAETFAEQAISTYVASLEQEVLQFDHRIKTLDELFSSEETGAKSLEESQLEERRLQAAIERTQLMFEVLAKNVEETRLVNNYEGYKSTVLFKPSNGYKVAPQPTRAMAMAGILGMMAGCGLAYLVDLADKSFHSPEEVGRQLSLSVIGHVPVMDVARLAESTAEGSHLAAPLCTVHRPRTGESEAYRTVRTALFFNARDKKHQVIQVTSPTPGDGKSTLSANLAVTIANSGKSVLLLDCDFRKPVQHKLFQLDHVIGFANVVDGSVEPEEAYHRIEEVPNLTVMPCGKRPTNPSELLSSAAFRERLKFLRSQFDYVIVDTPPLLAVSDPGAVAGQVDGVILTFRITNKTKPLALRARDMLKEVNADIVGVVINGISDKSSSGYYSYGGYRYGSNAYKYGYSYAYAYEEQEDKLGART